GFGDDPCIAFGVAEPDQLDRVIDLAFDAAVTFDRALQAGALAQQGLRRGRIVPQLGVFRLGVQLGEATVGHLPVKDASSAAPATFGCRRRPPESQRACSYPSKNQLQYSPPVPLAGVARTGTRAVTPWTI